MPETLIIQSICSTTLDMLHWLTLGGEHKRCGSRSLDTGMKMLHEAKYVVKRNRSSELPEAPLSITVDTPLNPWPLVEKRTGPFSASSSVKQGSRPCKPVSEIQLHMSIPNSWIHNSASSRLSIKSQCL
jgi:hypothetical protein